MSAVGWCHHCETFQLAVDAQPVQPWKAVPEAEEFGLDREYTTPGCVTTGCGQTWEFGIFDVDDLECAQYHAERRDAGYPGSCGPRCPGRRAPAGSRST